MMNFFNKKTEQNTLKVKLSDKTLQARPNAGFDSLSMILRDKPGKSHPEPILGSKDQHPQLFNYLEELLKAPEQSKDFNSTIKLLDQREGNEAQGDEAKKEITQKTPEEFFKFEIGSRLPKGRLLNALKPYILTASGCDFKSLVEQAEQAPYSPLSLSAHNKHQLFTVTVLEDLIQAYVGDVEPLLKAVADTTPDAKHDPSLIKTIAENLVKENPMLLTPKGKVKDLAGRTFNSITPFQYAVWAGDIHMVTMLVKHMDTSTVREQLTELKGKGIDYIDVNGEKVTGSHGFSLEQLFAAYQRCEKAIGLNRWDEANQIWCKDVGGAQAELPAYWVNQFCHPSRHFGDGDETLFAASLPRVLEFGRASWYSADPSYGKMGESFAVARGPGLPGPWCGPCLLLVICIPAVSWRCQPAFDFDIPCLQSLSNIIAERLKSLEALLSVNISQAQPRSRGPK